MIWRRYFSPEDWQRLERAMAEGAAILEQQRREAELLAEVEAELEDAMAKAATEDAGHE